MSDTSNQTPAQRATGDFLPKMAALIAGGNSEQLVGHMTLARTNGLSEDELKVVIVHLAFCTGWPRAMTAIRVAKEVFAG